MGTSLHHGSTADRQMPLGRGVKGRDLQRVWRAGWMPIAALICGIAQLVPPVGHGGVDIAQGCLYLMLAIVAIVLGHRVRREARQKGGWRRWFAGVGLVLGYGSIAWYLLMPLLALVVSRML
jgi:predicted Na+-dependent transporter